MSVNSPLLDPLQGFDIKVRVMSHASDTDQLVGAFTSLMFKIVNQTETYLSLNSRSPRMLDGEVIIVWSLEQGLVDLNVVANTYGPAFAAGLSAGRGTQIPRSTRFRIVFMTNLAPGDVTAMAINNEAGFRQSQSNITDQRQYSLNYCRADTTSFGVTAGRHIVANTWQGTAQNINVLNSAQGGSQTQQSGGSTPGQGTA